MVMIGPRCEGFWTSNPSASEHSTAFAFPLERKDLYEGATSCNRGHCRAVFLPVRRRARTGNQAAPGQSAGRLQNEQPGRNQQEAVRLGAEDGLGRFQRGF